MVSSKIDVAPDVLAWARESIGLSLDEAAKKVGISYGTLRMLEEGGDEPSIAQLRRMAEVYRRSLATLLLPEPPPDVGTLREFRLMQKNQEKAWSPALHRAFRRVQVQREVMQELSESSEEVRIPISLNLSLGDNPEIAGEMIRSWLGVTNEGKLEEWIELIERQSILVTQISDVPVDEMRGCSISDQPFPAIMLNGADAPAGRLFTLLHELAHILLRIGGVCDLDTVNHLPQSEREQIERFCNEVASAVLVPRGQILSDREVYGASRGTMWSDESLGRLANQYGVSREMMILRLIYLGRASWEFYFARREHYQQIYEEMRQKQRLGAGGHYYRTTIRNLGHTYTQAVFDAYHRHEITRSEASDYLGVKVNRLPRLESLLESR